MQLELLNEQGQATSKVDAPDTVFARDYNEALVHQIVVAFSDTIGATSTWARRPSSNFGALMRTSP